MTEDPRETVTNGNGRLPGGRFGPGNKCASGNRRGHLMALRKAMADVVTVSDVVDVMAGLLTLAKSGDVPAIKLLFDRLFGRPQDTDFPEDEIELSDDEKRQQLLSKFARLSPELQAQVRARIRERKPTTLAE